jgi:hypothetical protein
MQKRKIRSLGELITKLRSDLGDYSDPIWFRGHSRSSWKLVPGFHRVSKPTSERNLINRFRQNANLLVEQSPRSDFDWLFLMQHYGVPTRLLDWSESPLVGLYFAVTSNQNDDGTLWILKPLELNRQTTADPGDTAFISSFEDEALGTYSTLTVEKGSLKGILPVAVIATRNSARIQAQLGVFTISHSAKTPIEEIGDKSHVLQYEIPAICKARIQEELRLMGVTKFQIFPELTSIGDNLREILE